MIRPLDAKSAPDAVLACVHDLLATCHAEANPAEPYRSAADTAAFLRHPPASEARLHWLSGDAGFAQLRLPQGHVDVAVRPDARRAGAGSALLAAATDEARRRGLRRLTCTYGTDAGAAFAAAAGARPARRDVRSLLRLAAFAREPEPVDGYRVESWIGAAPEELVASYAEARLAINDAPDDLWEPWDAARVRELEHTLEERDRDVRVTVALRGDEVVAFTELRVSRSDGALGSTEDTAVVREHRGRRLGRWVKVESLCALRRDRPDVRLVTTTNAEENAAMLALNARLGFSRAATYTICVLEL